MHRRVGSTRIVNKSERDTGRICANARLPLSVQGVLSGDATISVTIPVAGGSGELQLSGDIVTYSEAIDRTGQWLRSVAGLTNDNRNDAEGAGFGRERRDCRPRARPACRIRAQGKS